MNIVQEVLKAKSDRINALLTEVATEISSLGLSFQYEISNGIVKAKKGKNGPAAAYWQGIRKIKDEGNLSWKQARKAYMERKASGVISTEVTYNPARGARVSKGQKQYWRKVRKLAAMNGISTTEARKLLMKPAA